MLKKMVFASHNKGKIAEIKEMLAPYGIEVLSANDLNLQDVEETGTTFLENAKLKAFAAAKEANLPALADDSGLCVDALDGRPGVYSARYAPNRDFDKAMDMLLIEMAESGKDTRKAHFSCVLVLANPDGTCSSFEGRVDGTIAKEKSGYTGFGFDPLFVPDGYDKTFAEMGTEEKGKISHRGRAFAKFIASLS